MCAIRKVAFGESLVGSLQQKVNKNHDFSRVDISNVVHPVLKTDSKYKKMTYVSSAIALASLGVAGVIWKKDAKSVKNLNKLISGLNQQLSKSADDINVLSEKLVKSTEKIKSLSDNVNTLSQKLSTVTNEVESKVAGVVQRSDNALSSINSKIDNIQNKSSEFLGSFQTRKVTVDGLEMNLARVSNEISGKVEEQMRSIIRSESTKRIFGLAEHSSSLPHYPIIRIPTSELIPYTKAGGMAVVPENIASNLAAVLNGHKKGALVLDTPLYTGQVAQNQFLSKVATISDETGKFEGKYEYVRKIFGGKQTKIVKLAELHEVQEMVVPVYSELGIVNEKVGVYITDLLESPVDWRSLRKRLTPEIRKEIADAIKSGKQYETDFIRVFKNPVSNELEATGKFRTVFYDSPKFDLSAKMLNEGEKFNLYRNDTLAAGETERMVYFSKFFTEQLYRSDESKYILKTIDLLDDAGKAVINAKTNKPAKEHIKLSADAIIGNDWHTGPISAILRQLTTLKKFYGMDPHKAEKLQNLPIMTILHNVEYQGSVWQGQEKLFNIMFGEHAAKIVENAFMPDIAVKAGQQGLPKHLWNSMMVGKDFNPQMMAASYSDFLTPVSEHYAEEIASHSGFGKAVHDIFKIRARKFEYENPDYIKSVLMRNNVDIAKGTGRKTLVGINNGCDTSNNILSKKVAREMERDLDLTKDSIIPYASNVQVLNWHNHNKGIYLNKIIEEVELAKNTFGKNNPMKLYMPELTDLTGVTVDTPVFALAGRLEDQKGLNILAKGIVEFYKNYKGNNPPIFYTQGVGVSQEFVNYLLNAKAEVAKLNPLAAKRMVVAGLFSEPGRYNGCKMMSDFTNMPSWFEPFGLVHKENAKFSGAIPIVNEVGGLTANLTDMLNALFVKYQHRFDPNINAVEINGKNLAQVFDKAVKIYEDKPQFAKMLEKSITADHGWLVKDGPIDKYINLLVDMNVLPKNIH